MTPSVVVVGAEVMIVEEVLAQEVVVGAEVMVEDGAGPVVVVVQEVLEAISVVDVTQGSHQV